MGITRNGIMSPMSGKAGPVIGRVVDGVGIICGLPKKQSTPYTAPQINIRTRFGLITRLFSYFTDVVRIGFPTKKKMTSAMNEAVSYNIKHAITGVGPDYTVDYTKLMISQGKLVKPSAVEITAVAQAKIQLNWFYDNTITENIGAMDELVALAYNQEDEEYMPVLRPVKRNAGTFTIRVPRSFVGKDVHVYLFFAGKAGRVSDSVYAGTIVPID